MKRKVRIIWDNDAKRSLKDIYNFIKSRESREAAIKVRDKIVSQSKSLGHFPEKFEKEPNLNKIKGNFRYKVIWSYKIIYEVTSDTIYVLDIFHTSRDPSNIGKKQ